MAKVSVNYNRIVFDASEGGLSGDLLSKYIPKEDIFPLSISAISGRLTWVYQGIIDDNFVFIGPEGFDDIIIPVSA